MFLKLFRMNEAALMRGRRMVGKGQPAAMDVQRAVKVDKRCAYRLHSNLAPATSLPDNVLMSTAHSSIVRSTD